MTLPNGWKELGHTSLKTPCEFEEEYGEIPTNLRTTITHHAYKNMWLICFFFNYKGKTSYTSFEASDEFYVQMGLPANAFSFFKGKFAFRFMQNFSVEEYLSFQYLFEEGFTKNIKEYSLYNIVPVDKKPNIFYDKFMHTSENQFENASYNLPGVNYVTTCPAYNSEEPQKGCVGTSDTLRHNIIHLNDLHKWTREKIADWLDDLHDSGQVNLEFSPWKEGNDDNEG